MRTPPQKAKSDSDLQTVIKATQKLWRRHHLSYDQTRHVAKEVRRALELERPQVRTRVIGLYLEYTQNSVTSLQHTKETMPCRH